MAKKKNSPKGLAGPGLQSGRAGLVQDASSGASATHPDTVLKGMKIPPNLMPGFIGAVKSGMQFVTNPSTHKYFLQQLGGPGTPAQKLSEGVYNLMLIIAHQAKGALPPQMIIPAGMYLISWCADYVKRAKLLPISDRDIADAMQEYLHDVITKTQAGAQQQGIAGRQMAQGPQQPGRPAQGGQQPPTPGPALPKMQAAPAAANGANPTLGPGATPVPGQPPQGA
jgi:hypothetical protein